MDDERQASRRARLQQLQAKMSASASANRSDVAEEQASRRQSSQKHSVGTNRKLAKAERLLDERDMREAGKDVERHRAMQYSIEENEAWEKKLEDKEQTRDKGAIGTSPDSPRLSGPRRAVVPAPDPAAQARHGGVRKAERARGRAAGRAHLGARPRAGGRGKCPGGGGHLWRPQAGRRGSRPPRLAPEQRVRVFADPRQDQIRRRSRRREDDPDAEITYINEKNKHFNKKIKRVRATTDAVL